MRAGCTLAVSSVRTNLIDCCKPVLARGGNRGDSTASQGVLTWIHGDSAGCSFLSHQCSVPRSNREYTHCCRAACPYRSKTLRHKLVSDAVLTAFRHRERHDALPAPCPKSMPLRRIQVLTRRNRRQNSSVGWRLRSNEYLYDVLGLYWDWKIQPLPGVAEVK